MKKGSRWQAYEHRVFDELRGHFRAATVERDVRLKGLFSRRMRQIDALIVERSPAGEQRTIVDAKCFAKKVDVKTVEAFAGLVSDVGADRGLLITNVGYTTAALNRAYYGSGGLELDILTFAELQRLQSFGAIMYLGDYAFVVPAPFGWIVDGTKTDRVIGTLYRRGDSKDNAMRRLEFAYVNIWDRVRDPISVDDLDAQQVEGMHARGSVIVCYPTTAQRSDARVMLRIAKIARVNRLEVTGFLEYPDCIFFCVLFTSLPQSEGDIRRLESMLHRTIRIPFVRDNSALIDGLKDRLKNESLTAHDRAMLLWEAGHWARDMKAHDQAREMLEQAHALLPTHYGILRDFLVVVTTNGDKREMAVLLRRVLDLDPRNPGAFNEPIEIMRDALSIREYVEVFDSLARDNPSDSVIQGNCHIYSAMLWHEHDGAEARRRLLEARRHFGRTLPRRHYVFGMIRQALADLDSRPGQAAHTPVIQ